LRRINSKGVWQHLSSLSRTLFDSIKESFGYPVSLYKLLDACPDLYVVDEPRDISWESVGEWHEWGSPSYNHYLQRFCHDGLMGWHYAGDGYTSFFEEFVDFGSREIIENWVCDIQDVVGFAASKSKLKDFSSLDHMVETKSREMIDPITDEKLQENLGHHGIRILHNKESSDFFARCAWDGRVFLVNSDGSHHFAAARYIAAPNWEIRSIVREVVHLFH